MNGSESQPNEQRHQALVDFHVLVVCDGQDDDQQESSAEQLVKHQAGSRHSRNGVGSEDSCGDGGRDNFLKNACLILEIRQDAQQTCGAVFENSVSSGHGVVVYSIEDSRC